eukprot:850969-Amphidinium_carterae.1
MTLVRRGCPNTAAPEHCRAVIDDLYRELRQLEDCIHDIAVASRTWQCQQMCDFFWSSAGCRHDDKVLDNTLETIVNILKLGLKPKPYDMPSPGGLGLCGSWFALVWSSTTLNLDRNVIQFQALGCAEC